MQPDDPPTPRRTGRYVAGLTVLALLAGAADRASVASVNAAGAHIDDVAAHARAAISLLGVSPDTRDDLTRDLTTLAEVIDDRGGTWGPRWLQRPAVGHEAERLEQAAAELTVVVHLLLGQREAAQSALAAHLDAGYDAESPLGAATWDAARALCETSLDGDPLTLEATRRLQAAAP